MVPDDVDDVLWNSPGSRHHRQNLSVSRGDIKHRRKLTLIKVLDKHVYNVIIGGGSALK